MEKVLIIKNGHCETFAEVVCRGICSLGDIARSIPYFRYLDQSFDVSILTDQSAKSFFGRFFIDAKMYFDISQLSLESFDHIINLEKNNDFLSLLPTQFGFYKEDEKLQIRQFPDGKRLLFHDFNSAKWNFHQKMNLMLGIDCPMKKGSSLNLNVVGLNWQSGPKWPEKMLEFDIWKDIESSLSHRYEVSWQQGFEDLNAYMAWINSCDTVITLDSLGLHLALLLDKKVIALFGPTDHEEFSDEQISKIFYRTKQEKSNLISQITKVLL